MQTLPKTKFSPPLLHREIIPRAGLTTWLQKAIPTSRLVLLSAPAGYGKTTLLSTLPAAFPDFRIAWFTLDMEDNDPVRFLSGLGEALGSIDPELRKVVEAQITASAGMISGGAADLPLRQCMVLLINSVLLLQTSPFILVLDDLHEITNPAIYDALNYLLENLPPRMHLAVTTRREPPLRLQRLRARRQLAELNLTDLRFNLQESQFFLNKLLDLDISETDLSTLMQKTEGWPVGLVLLTSRLRNLPDQHDRATVLQDLARVDSLTFQYLAEEVLSQQSGTVSDFLLAASVLSEFTPSLCRILTGQKEAETLLDEIYHRNLFLLLVREKANEEEPVYRFHALFSEFLQRELERQDARLWHDLHMQAARLEKEPGRIIYHLLAAREWNAAAEQIEAVSETYLQNGMHETVMGWIAALPEKMVNNDPTLMFLRGYSNLIQGNLDEAHSSLERSLLLLAPGQESPTRGKTLVGLASLAFIRTEFSRCDELVSMAEADISRMDEERIDFLMLRASLALFWRSDWPVAKQSLLDSLKLVEISEDPKMWFRFSLYLGPEFTVLPGVLDILETFCTQAKGKYGQLITPLRLGIEDTWAGIHLRRGRLQMAIETGRDALLTKKKLGGYPFLGINASLSIASAYTGMGKYAAAEEFLQQSSFLMQESPLNRALTGAALYPLGKLRWLEGRHDDAHQILQQMTALDPKAPYIPVLQKMLAGLLEISARRYTKAETLLHDALQLQAQEWVSEFYGSARLFLAFLYDRWEKPRESMANLDAVLSMCEKNQTPGLILQDLPIAAPLLRVAVKKGMRARQAASLLETMGLSTEEGGIENSVLTARQMEILHLIAAGYSNHAIADKLVLSLATVKSHVVHIMNRLGATSRMEAVAHARKDGLL